MKGFIKACLIAVLVFVVAGIVLLVVAAAGGVTRASLRLFSDEGRLGYGPVKIRLDDGFSVNFGEDEHKIVIYDNADGNGIVYSQGKYEIASQDIKELSVDVEIADFYIEESRDGSFYVQTDSSDVKVKLDGNCLDIEYDADRKFGIDIARNAEVILFVPAGYQFDTVSLEVGAGFLNICTSLYSRDCDMTVGAGNLLIDRDITADQVKIEVGAGEADGSGCITAKEYMELSVDAGSISLDQIDCLGTLAADCGLGRLAVDGLVAGDVKAEVDVGEMELDLRSDGQKYTYKLDVGVGEIEVDDFSYSGVDNRIILEGDENAPQAELSCGVGHLEISIN